jgi:hypothetical protein
MVNDTELNYKAINYFLNMETDNIWIIQLRRLAEGPNIEKREAALMLLIALGAVIEKFKRIRELAKLLSDYRLTSPSLLQRWRFCL